MTKRNKYRSPVAASAHETISDLHKMGFVDAQTMREFDIRCLTTVEPLSGDDIAALRRKAKVSQAIFARALNLTTNHVAKLESGAKRPSGATLKLLSLMKQKGFEAIL